VLTGSVSAGGACRAASAASSPGGKVDEITCIGSYSSDSGGGSGSEAAAAETETEPLGCDAPVDTGADADADRARGDSAPNASGERIGLKARPLPRVRGLAEPSRWCGGENMTQEAVGNACCGGL